MNLDILIWCICVVFFVTILFVTSSKMRKETLELEKSRRTIKARTVYQLKAANLNTSMMANKGYLDDEIASKMIDERNDLINEIKRRF